MAAFLPEPTRHIVVFDCNVYLDVAALTGEPYSQADFNRLAAENAKVPVPHPTNRAIDSLRALAVCTTGVFAGVDLLEVWTCDHINGVVVYKAEQSAEPDPTTGHKGLGWQRESAEALVRDLIERLVCASNGGSAGDPFPDGNPPLDHEDGKVYGACRHLAGDDPLSRVFCVTRDGGFLAAYRDGRLQAHTVVLTPAQFVTLVRRARVRAAMPRPVAAS